MLGSILIFVQFVLMGRFICICASVGMWTLRLLDSISWSAGLLVGFGIHMSALHCRWSLSETQDGVVWDRYHFLSCLRAR